MDVQCYSSFRLLLIILYYISSVLSEEIIKYNFIKYNQLSSLQLSFIRKLFQFLHKMLCLFVYLSILMILQLLYFFDYAFVMESNYNFVFASLAFLS